MNLKDTTKDAIIEALMIAWAKKEWEGEDYEYGIYYDDGMPHVTLEIDGRTHSDVGIETITGLKLK